MRIYVWNRTGRDLWSGGIPFPDAYRVVLRAWDELPPGAWNARDRLADGVMATFDAPDATPIDPGTGMPRVRFTLKLRGPKMAVTAAKGAWLGRDCFIIAPDRAGMS